MCSHGSSQHEVMLKILNRSVSPDRIRQASKANRDKNGVCKLKGSQDFGHCLTEPDMKRLISSSIGVKTNYLRPLVYEANRKGIISNKSVKSAGYNPKDVTGGKYDMTVSTKQKVAALEEDAEIIHLEYTISKIDEDFYHKPTEAELEGNYRLTGPFVALMPGKWNHWDFQTYPEVVPRDAHTFLEQPDGDPAYVTLGHSKNPRDRIGQIVESYGKDDKVIQKMKITHPDGIKLYDAKLLGKRVSIEADAKIDLKNSTPDNRIVLGYQGRDVAIVKRPACVTCPSAELEELTSKIENQMAGEEMTDKSENGEVNELPDFVKSESKLTDFIKGLWKTFQAGEEGSEEGEQTPSEPTPTIEPAASLEKDEKGDETINLEEKLKKQESKIVELEKQNEKYEEYFTKLQEQKARDERIALEKEVTDLTDKLGIELEDKYFEGKEDAELHGEIRGYTAMLSKLPDGQLPHVIMNTREKTDSDLAKEVAELEKELGSSNATLEI